MTLNLYHGTRYCRIPDQYTRPGVLTLDELGLYAMNQNQLAWLDRQPDRPLPIGGERTWVQQHTSNGKKSFNRSWKGLQDKGLLKCYRFPSGGRDHFGARYELLTMPDKTIPATQNVTKAKAAELSLRRRVQVPTEKYLAVPCAVLEDPNLSLREKGLYIVAQRRMSLELNGVDTVMAKSDLCGRDGVNATAWNGLKRKGYLQLVRFNDADTGLFCWGYILQAEPTLQAAVPPIVDRKTTPHVELKPATARPAQTAQERAAIAAIIDRNIGTDVLLANALRAPLYYRAEDVVGLRKLMIDTVCSQQSTLRIGGEILPTQVVREQLLRLNADHILAVLQALDGVEEGTIFNPRAYKLTALYRAADTMSDYLTDRAVRYGYGA